jgi:hypothetical protein
MCIIIFHECACGINKFGIVDLEKSVEVIVVKRKDAICMFGTDNSGFLQLNPGALIRSNSVKQVSADETSSLVVRPVELLTASKSSE